MERFELIFDLQNANVQLTSSQRTHHFFQTIETHARSNAAGIDYIWFNRIADPIVGHVLHYPECFATMRLHLSRRNFGGK